MHHVRHDQITESFDSLYQTDAPHGLSLATVVLHQGQLVAERYGHQPESIFGPGSDVQAETTLISWSMAKSITHAVAGIVVNDGLLSLDDPAPVAAWAGTDKESISIQNLLDMKPGLLFVEDYVDDQVSHCLEMLYGVGQGDVAAYAASLPLAHQPGSTWNYSSGSTNIVARILADAIAPYATDGGRAAMSQLLTQRLFGPIGMHSAQPKFDDAGTFVGSSYVYATARDFARFGELYRNDGMVANQRILPAGWAAHAAKVVAHDDGFDYGRHWWVWPDQPKSLACHGYEGQYVVVLPERELVVVHLGKSPIARRPLLLQQLRKVIDAFPAIG